MASEAEVLAALDVLVAVAQADGVISVEERAAIEAVLHDTKLPLDVDALLAKRIDLDEAAARVTSREVQRQTFAAATAMAMTDRDVAEKEVWTLSRLRQAWSITSDEAESAKRQVQLLAGTVMPSSRDVSIDAKRILYGYAVGSVALGAFPIPGVSIVTDVACVALQRRLIGEIARVHGRVLSTGEIGAAFGAMAGLAAVRIAVVSLLKLVPVWGWIVGGASAFATTWALGMAVHENLKRGGSLKPDELRAQFTAAKADGERYFEQHQQAIEAEAKARSADVAALSQSAARGEPVQEQLLQQMAPRT
jgi:uncharacterized protein (DUF697 family)